MHLGTEASMIIFILSEKFFNFLAIFGLSYKKIKKKKCFVENIWLWKIVAKKKKRT